MNVLLIGAGALGSEIIEGIIDLQLKIDLLTIVDPDIIEESNMNRQSIYKKNTIFYPKAQILSLHCKDKASKNIINTEAIISKIEEQPIALIRDRDIIIIALDNLPSRLYVNEWIFQELNSNSNAIIIECGTQGWNGHCRLIRLNSFEMKDPCIQCTVSLYVEDSNIIPICSYGSKAPITLEEVINKSAFYTFPIRFPFIEVDLFLEDHLQIIYDLTLEEAIEGGIDYKNLSLSYCKDHLRNIIPSIATTTSYVAAMSLDLAFSSKKDRINFIYYNGEIHPPSKTEIFLERVSDCSSCSKRQ